MLRALVEVEQQPARHDGRSWPLAEPGSGATPKPLGIEVKLAPFHGRYQRPAGVPAQGPVFKLVARVVTRGRSGWIVGSLSWMGLDHLNRGYGPDTNYDERHIHVLRDLYALYQASSGRPRYLSYSSSQEKSIELSAFGSRQLWPLLDEARRIGVQLVHGSKRLGPIDPYRTLEVGLDVTVSDDAGHATVTPVLLQADDAEVPAAGDEHLEPVVTDVTPVAFIGSNCHGVVCAATEDVNSRSEHDTWRLSIARLTRPVPAALREMVLEGESLRIPAPELDRFATELCPRLRGTARVISSDGSFDVPDISAPRLCLHAVYGTRHHLSVAWEWLYDVGTTTLRAPLDALAGEAGFRDLDAEAALVADLGLPLDQFPMLTRQAPDSAGSGSLPPRLAPTTELLGADTMRFTTELLPLLAEQPGIVVEQMGTPADYREATDSMRIGVSTGDIAGESDWFDLGIRITVDGQTVPFVEVFMALSRDDSHMLLADGAYFSLQKPELQMLRRLIDEARALQDMTEGSLRISRYQASLWEELTALGVVEHQADAWQRQVGGLLSLDAIETTNVPASVTAQLRDYQVDGFRWLTFLWQHRLGGILADDMGLGKTLQSLALICHAKELDPGDDPFLVVAPTSVVTNWRAEIARFAPHLQVATITDTERRRGCGLPEAVAGADVVITSYTLLRLESDDYMSLPWAGMILDEAQAVKNHQSRTYQCARQLPAPFKVAITGTPMENNLMELWALLSITAPGLFPHPTRFRDHYARPIERNGDTELLAQLRRRIRPLVKRRTKDQVVEALPDKRENVLDVRLDRKHRKIYDTHLQRERQRVLGLIDDFNKHRFTILRSLTLLRQLSLHPVLVDPKHADVPCAKLDTLTDLVREAIDGGHRALVFSQFTRFLGLARARLETAGVEHCYLDGKTRDRQTVLERFKTGDAPVFLISLKAGGFGLNLTEADHCFLLDPWWNPATEAQAVDRTHRIGQTRDVTVHRLIASDTIDEKVMALKQRKAELFANVMDDGNLFSTALTPDDIRTLLT